MTGGEATSRPAAWHRAAPAAAVALVAFLLPGTGCVRGSSDPGVEAVIGSTGRSPGRFASPRSIAFDPATGDLCVVDRSGRIQRFEPAVEGAADAGIDGAGIDGADGGGGWRFANEWHLPAYQKGQPTGINYDRDGNLLVADTHYQRIRVFDPRTGELLRSFGGEGDGPGRFTQVRDVVQDSQGNIYAGDFNGPRDRIQKLDPTGEFLLDFGSTGSEPGQFRRPQGMAVHVLADGSETLLVADSCNHRIQRFDLDGRFVESWGGPGTGPGEFGYPYGIAVERRPGGDVFVVEWQNNRVQRFDADGDYLGSWGGPGREVGRLATPWDVALTVDERLAIADFGNDRVQIVRWPAGRVALVLPHSRGEAR